MKKINTKAEKTTIIQSGLKVQAWIKECPCCHKKYTTTSRGQKYCSSECLKKATTRKRKQKHEYNKNIDIHRLSARAHSLAVEVCRNLVQLGVIEYKCAGEGCECTENLQVHHRNLRYLDNSPENLVYLCPKCHAKVHSDLERVKQSKESLAETYGNMGIKLYEVILKS